MLRIILIALLWLFLASVTTSCAQGVTASGAADDQGSARVIEEYRLAVADKVRVTIFGEAALTGEFLVAGSGEISIPLIGETQASGTTIGEFQKEIAATLRDGFITEPRVSAQILNYRPFYIFSEVNTPGEYPYTNNLTVLNPLATSG